jgi:hypothetical protein
MRLMRPRTGFAVLAVALLLIAGGAGCGGGGDTAISTGTLSGMVGGKPWTLASAETNAFLSTGGTFFADLYSETFTACSGASSSATGDSLIFTVPKTVGDHPLGLSLTETFYIRATQDNLAATRGHIVVDSVTAVSIVGGAAITFDGQNTVNGRFQIAICP